MFGFETPTTPLQAMLGLLDQALVDVERIEPNRFRARLAAQADIIDLYDVICELHHACGDVRDLRDTSDPRVHEGLDRVGRVIQAIDGVLRFVIHPKDDMQEAEWRRICEAQPNGRFLMTNGAALAVSALTTECRSDEIVTIRRVWTDTYMGRPVALALPIAPPQGHLIRRRIDVVRDDIRTW